MSAVKRKNSRPRNVEKFRSRDDAYAVIRNSDARSLYACAMDFTRFYAHYNNDGWLSVNHTSTILMKKMLKNTTEVPVGQTNAMRSERDMAFETFAYMYGAYTFSRMKNLWNSKGLVQNSKSDELLAAATCQVLDEVVDELKRSNWRKGTFHHLLHRMIRWRMLDAIRSFCSWKKEQWDECSLDELLEKLGDKFEFDPTDDGNELLTSDHNGKSSAQIASACLLMLFDKVETRNTEDDREMAIRFLIEKEPQALIAKEFGISIAAVSMRIKKFIGKVAKLRSEYESFIREAQGW